jgi:hypothetical protein
MPQYHIHILWDCLTLNMAAQYSFETPVTNDPSTPRNIPEDFEPSAIPL